MNRTELHNYMQDLLSVDNFNDYCPNGLQVEGKLDINKIVTGVTSSKLFIEAAVAAKADAIIVHHGFFWNKEPAPITGIKYHRLKLLMEHKINLFAYHLPLDAHPIYGNNMQLAKHIGIEVTCGFDQISNVGNFGNLSQSMTGKQLFDNLERALQRTPLHIEANRKIKKIAWCTGAGQGLFEYAVSQGIDAYITGEISEATTHIAREANVHFFACGHHATERYGVKSLGEHLAENFKVEHEFIDIDNPV